MQVGAAVLGAAKSENMKQSEDRITLLRGHQRRRNSRPPNRIPRRPQPALRHPAHRQQPLYRQHRRPAALPL